MAMSSTTVFTAFLSTTAPLSGPSPSLLPVRSLPVNLRLARIATYATASESASEPRVGRGIMKPRPVSPEMQEFVGAPVIARTTALKLIWAYIKENNLQDPQNKKIIVCDEKLKTIFGEKDRVGFLEVAKLISPHFIK